VIVIASATKQSSAESRIAPSLSLSGHSELDLLAPWDDGVCSYAAERAVGAGINFPTSVANRSTKACRNFCVFSSVMLP
jgi:hypothetical protein